MLLIELGLWLVSMMPLVAFFYFANPCCCVCAIVNDTFSTNTSSSYTLTGTWSYDSGGGELETSSNGASAIYPTALDAGRGLVTVGMSGTSGLKGYVYGAWVDADNHVFLEVTFGAFSNTIKLYKRVAGVNTQLGDTLGGTGTYFICWNGYYAHGGTTSGIVTFDEYTGTGTKGGFGADASGGTVSVTSFKLEKSSYDQSDCPRCGCSFCTDNPPTYRRNMQIVIAGMANGTCANCTDLNGTYLLTSGTGCGWGFFIDPLCDALDGTAEWSDTEFTFFMMNASGQDFDRAALTFGQNSAPGGFLVSTPALGYWEENHRSAGTTKDCSDVVDMDYADKASTSPAADMDTTGFCDRTGMTIEATPLTP